MNQEQLTRAIAKRFFTTKARATAILEYMLSEMTYSLKNRRRVYFRRFGAFHRITRPPKRVRDPSGRWRTIPARPDVDFRPSRHLLKAVDKRRPRAKKKKR